MRAAGAKILAAPIFGEGHSTRSFAKPIPTPRILVTTHVRLHTRARRIRVEEITALRVWRVDDGWAARARLQTSSPHPSVICMHVAQQTN